MDTLLILIALVGIGIGVFSYFYTRKQRSRREAVVSLTHGILQRTEGILAGIRPSISDPAMLTAINDGIAAIAKASKQLVAV